MENICTFSSVNIYFYRKYTHCSVNSFKINFLFIVSTKQKQTEWQTFKNNYTHLQSQIWEGQREKKDKYLPSIKPQI